MVGNLSKEILHNITTNLTHYFFNKYLRGIKTVDFPKFARKYANIEFINI